LVGNKSDLTMQRKVPLENIQNFLETNIEAKYIETSAKTAEKV
jgi:GTPase SAR1 family protein